MHYGRIHTVDEKSRTITFTHKGRRRRYYFQRAMYQRFSPFLRPGNFIALLAKAPRRRRGRLQWPIKDVYRIEQPGRRPRTLYSQRRMRCELARFVNSLGVKLFLDLEMSMHPYRKDDDFIQEIIQAGYILEDATGKVVQTYSRYIRPTRHEKVSLRTKKFLGVSQDDVDEGIDFSEFYEHFKEVLATYRPAVIVWGRNDSLSLKEAYEINDVLSLDDATRFVDLLSLHKNYLRRKNDIGLFKAYKAYGYEKENQLHDALEVARMTRAVFYGFQALVNANETLNI